MHSNHIIFEKHVTHFYDFIGDKLIIGKFCAIAKGVEFVMNGANHCASERGTTIERRYHYWQRCLDWSECYNHARRTYWRRSRHRNQFGCR